MTPSSDQLLAALDDLQASAARLRSALHAATTKQGFRDVALATGLTVNTIQRWRMEHPTAATLHARSVGALLDPSLLSLRRGEG